MIKQKCTRLERCEVNLQHKKYRGIWLAGVKFLEGFEPREELLEYSTFYGVVHCLVVCLVHCVVRRNTVRSTLLFEVRIVQSGYWNVLKSLVVIWSRFYAVWVLARLHLRSRGRTPWLTAVICEWNWMESWLFMILERTRSNCRISHVQIFCSYFDISIFGFTFFWLARRIGRCFSSGSPRRTSGFFSGAFNRHITT